MSIEPKNALTQLREQVFEVPIEDEGCLTKEGVSFQWTSMLYWIKSHLPTKGHKIDPARVTLTTKDEVPTELVAACWKTTHAPIPSEQLQSIGKEAGFRIVKDVEIDPLKRGFSFGAALAFLAESDCLEEDGILLQTLFDALLAPDVSRDREQLYFQTSKIKQKFNPLKLAGRTMRQYVIEEFVKEGTEIDEKLYAAILDEDLQTLPFPQQQLLDAQNAIAKLVGLQLKSVSIGDVSPALFRSLTKGRYLILQGGHAIAATPENFTLFDKDIGRISLPNFKEYQQALQDLLARYPKKDPDDSPVVLQAT